ncbi:MAG: GNAT family N-acetyltransferase [Oscillospiraceae bacterium]|nr:GNAT family N-acetyltransferase [Oscillospiraceae bacterium]
MLRCEVFDTINDPKLRSAWENLQTGNDMTAFQHYSWYQILEDEFKENKLKRLFGKIQYYLAYADDNPIAIAPFFIQSKRLKIGKFGYERGIYFLGVRGYSDYLNMIYKEMKEDALKLILWCAMENTGVKKVTLNQIPENTSVNNLLKYGVEGLHIKATGIEQCVRLFIPEDSNEFLMHMHKQFRQNYRTQKNRSARDGFQMVSGIHQGLCDEKTIERIDQIHKERFDKKNERNLSMKATSLFMIFRKKYNEIAAAMRSDSDSILFTGSQGDEIICYIHCLQDEKALRVTQMGFDQKYADRSPTMTMLIDYILEHFDEFAGTTIDFTRGEERYKYRMGGIQHLICDYEIKKDYGNS